MLNVELYSHYALPRQVMGNKYTGVNYYLSVNYTLLSMK